MRRLLLLCVPGFWMLSVNLHAEAPFSGSGYEKAEGWVINYTYNHFGGFYLTIVDHTLRWEGFHGYFNGLVSANPPQISEVAPDVFLFSWRTRGNGSDNVLQNFNTRRVVAHLQPDDGQGEAIQMIHGVIHCRNTPKCNTPSAALTPPPQMMAGIAGNAREFGFPPLFDASVNNTPRAQADIVAREALAGQVIVYDTPEGEYRIEVDGDVTRVAIAGAAPKAYQTYASTPQQDIFFISWMGGVGGNHVVVNRATGQVFDHILPSGERHESIFELSCFGPADECR